MTLHNPHDALFRAAFESPRNAASLLRALLPPDLLSLIALDSLSLQSGDGRGKQLEEFRTDLLFKADIAGSPGFVCFLFEHQSQSEPSMPLRVLGYQLRIWERQWRQHPGAPLPPIVPLVISHDPRGWSAPSDFVQLFSKIAREHPALRAVTPSFQYVVDDLSHLSDTELKARALDAFPTLALWALRDARAPGQILATLDQWADALTDTANAAHGRDALQQPFLYISTVAENLTVDKFKKRLVELAPAAEEAIMTIAEQLRAEGLKEGLTIAEKLKAEGLKEGLEQGLERGQRQTLAKLLALKFGPLSDAIVSRIEGADAKTLDRWLERILTADSAESVLAA